MKDKCKWERIKKQEDNRAREVSLKDGSQRFFSALETGNVLDKTVNLANDEEDG